MQLRGDPPPKRRVFIVDDHPIVREGLALLIDREPDLTVCGDAEEMHTALQLIEELKPDILIVDVSLSGPDGLDLLKNIRAKDAALPVLILSMHDESIYAERALRVPISPGAKRPNSRMPAALAEQRRITQRSTCRVGGAAHLFFAPQI